MIDIEIKPPDLNGIYTCYCPYTDYDNIQHKSAEKILIVFIIQKNTKYIILLLKIILKSYNWL